ncbi:DEAD/DEAH box helicase [Endothiovibrio diazotrophicus]
MPFDLGLLPSGHLHGLSVADAVPSPGGQGRPGLADAFARHVAEGLFELAADRSTDGLTPTLRYWHDFAGSYLGARCRLPDPPATQDALPADHPEDPAPPVAPLTAAEAERWLQAAPPMQGAEYLGIDLLCTLWNRLDHWVRARIREHGSLAALLDARAPQWHPLGRVCFHLAENRRDPDYPFAFMATYAPDDAGPPRGRGAARYQPLRNALREYADADDKPGLVRLLSPVHRAAVASPLIDELVKSGDLYHPLAWTPEEAYRFLREVPRYEESGLVVRLPDWWRKRSRPQVGVRIGNERQGGLGKEALLDFELQVVIDDEPLSEAELAALSAAEAGLVFLKGRWVEVDRQRLDEALSHWRTVAAEAREGRIGFTEGMRLLAGAPVDLGRADDDQARQAWSRVRPGEWLAGVLEQLRAPQGIAAARPGKGLKGTLRPYQEQGVNWLWLLSRLGLGACLADDMGLGKTIQIIALLLRFKQHPPAGEAKPSLLLLPASLLANWQTELERFAPSLRTRFVHGSQLDDTPRPDGEGRDHPPSLADCDLVLTTYGTLTRREWLQGTAWRLVILDEAQAIKNPATRQTKAVKRLQADARIALTGTPVENSLSDLWSLFDFLNPGLLGSAKRFKGFVDSLAAREHDQYAPLRRLTGPYILRRLKTDRRIIDDLPEKSEVDAWCNLSRVQVAQYRRAVKELKHGLETLDGIQRRGLVLAYLQRFKQICNHPAQGLGGGDYEPKNSGKFQRLAELCEEIASRQEKVLVFTQFREITAPLAAFLAEIFGRPGLILHGGTPVRQRRERVEAFQREEGPPFFVLSLKAGGTGLTLTEASHVIHFDRWWNPAVENQATDRAFRIGQRKNVLVHKFICRGTIEEKIDALIREKRSLADDLLRDGGELPLTEMDDAALLDLVALDLDPP